MKRILLIALCCLILTACGSHADSEIISESTTDATSAPTSATETSPHSPIKFHVYYPNEALDGLHVVETETSELNVTAVVEALQDAGVLNADICVNSIKIENTQLYIDFNEAFYTQLIAYGTTGERFFVGSIVNTFLSAYGGDSVLITVNGETAESGHVIYDFPMEKYE